MRWLRRLATGFAVLAALLALSLWWRGWGRHAAVFAPPPAEARQAARAALGLGLDESPRLRASPTPAPPAIPAPASTLSRLDWQRRAYVDQHPDFLVRIQPCLDAFHAGDAEGAWCLQELLALECSRERFLKDADPVAALEAKLVQYATNPQMVAHLTEQLQLCRNFWHLPPDVLPSEEQLVKLLLDGKHPLATLQVITGKLGVDTDRETRALMVEAAWRSGDPLAMIRIDRYGRAALQREARESGGAAAVVPLAVGAEGVAYALLYCRLDGSCDRLPPIYEGMCKRVPACPTTTSLEQFMRLTASLEEFRLGDAAASEMQPWFERRDPTWPPYVAWLRHLRTHDTADPEAN